MPHAYEKLVHIVTESATSIMDSDYTALLDKIGHARFVLIGEASHGTHEFYQAREDITKALITQKDFMGVAIEGDWPDAYPIHRYIQGVGNKTQPELALQAFQRFPTWMWRNTTMPPFLQWLRNFNDYLPQKNKIGFYGLDLYSLHHSMQAVINYLTKVDPEAAVRASKRYACFDHLNSDPQTYAYLVSSGVKKTCVKEVTDQLFEMQQRALELTQQDDFNALENHFYAAQNARVVKNAERYYRALFEDHTSSWNIRDTHMMETLNILADDLENRFKKPAKVIIWAHNSHLGDARATEMGLQGEINLGQLVREQYEDSYSIGFSTYQGTVTAASDWDAPAECKNVIPGIAGSYEALFHDIPYPQFLLDLHQKEKLQHFLDISRLQRAIGVIYRPETERQSHYFFTRLPYQFDSLIHIDETHALVPLDVNPEWQASKESTS